MVDGRLQRGWRLFRLTVVKTRNDGILLFSAALAFLTIISLVPLLSTFSYLSARIYTQRGQTQIVVDFLGKILPWSEGEILLRVEEFLAQAETIHGLGFVFFLVTVLAVFGAIENTINEIWRVSSPRPFRLRLLSFTLVFFWGPLLIGASYSLVFLVRRQPAFQRIDVSLLLELIPFAVTLVGLTMLYWLVPHTHVRFRAALTGGLVASLMLEAVRWGFGRYVDMYEQYSVYGSFGLVLFFMVSLNVAWLLVLVGSEVAYCTQHAEHMLGSRRDPIPADGSWLALQAMVTLTQRFRSGEPILEQDALADTLALDPTDVARLLAPLTEAGLVSSASGEDEDGYLLTCDPYQVSAAEVVAHFDGDTDNELGALRAKVDAARRRAIGKQTLADLARIDDET